MKSEIIIILLLSTFYLAAASFLNEYRRAEVVGILQYDSSEGNLRLIGLRPGMEQKFHLNIPNWVLYRTRKTGKYLLPLKKKENFLIPLGENYDLPLIQDNFFPYQHFLVQYLSVKSPELEIIFLRKALSNNTIPGMRTPILQRLVELGEFSQPFSNSQIIYWRNLYLSGILHIPEKRLVLQSLSYCNFFGLKMVFEYALRDNRLCELAGRLYREKDKAGFETLMLKYISDNQNWRIALRQSELLYDNKDCISQLYRRFDKKNPFNSDLKYFIPVLCIENFQDGSPVIQQILETDKDPTHFELFRRIAFWINRTNATPYVKSIHIYLQNHSQTEYLKQSVIYPTLLCALCKAKDQFGNILTIEYLSALKRKNKPAQLDVALELFRAENPNHFSLEELIEAYKQRVIKAKNKK